MKVSARSIVIAVLGLAGLAGGCSDDAEDSPPAAQLESADGGADARRDPADACKEHDCSNVIDAVILPMLYENGLAITKEEDSILCRRMAIDLTGLAPTPAELADHCAGKTPKEMATYFMEKPTNAIAVDGSPPYVFIRRRAWADRLHYSSSTNRTSTYYFYVREIDTIVGDLYAGKIRYDEFVRRVLAHPAFVKRFGDFNNRNYDLVQLASQAFRTFLGREALPVEAVNFGNLWRGWASRLLDEDESHTLYPDCPFGTQPAGNDACGHEELGLDGTQCAGSAKSSCQSTVLGNGELVPTVTTFTRYYDLPAADKTAIEAPGRLVVAQPEFAEVAADVALEPFIGWWKAGVFKPSFDVPAVRSALGRKLAADGYDVRKMDFEIVTSVLYTQAATRDNPDKIPLWAFGPTKILNGVSWLENFAQPVGVNYGVFDFRYRNSTMFVDHFKNLPNQTWSFYRIGMQDDLGDDGGLIAVFTRRSALESDCDNASKAVAATATREQLVDKAFEWLGRPASPDERAVFLAELAAPGGDGCSDLASCDRAKVAKDMCRSLFATGLFTYY